MSKVTNLTDLKEAVDRFIQDMERIGITPGVEVVNTDRGRYLVVAFTVEEMLTAIREKRLAQYADRIEARVIPFNGEHWIRIAVRI
jgi:hypothetical protein